jgi:hypothetical protein
MEGFIIMLVLMFLLVVFVIFLIGFLIYKLFRSINLPKMAILATVAYTLFIIYIPLSIIYEDELFFKHDAIEIVEDMDFKLKDDFKIIDNSFNAYDDEYNQTFSLEISNQDKNRLIHEIKSSKNFIPVNQYDSNSKIYPDRYVGSKVSWNYENKENYIREYFEPMGENISPIKRIISISKTSNELTFLDSND